METDDIVHHRRRRLLEAELPGRRLPQPRPSHPAGHQENANRHRRRGQPLEHQHRRHCSFDEGRDASGAPHSTGRMGGRAARAQRRPRTGFLAGVPRDLGESQPLKPQFRAGRNAPCYWFPAAIGRAAMGRDAAACFLISRPQWLVLPIVDRPDPPWSPIASPGRDSAGSAAGGAAFDGPRQRWIS